MHPTQTPGGANRPGTTVLPDATREEMLTAAGLSTSAHWAELDDELLTADLAFDESEAWHVVWSKGGDHDGGGTAHRGVLHPDEHVDLEELQRLIEAELGFTFAQVKSVYRQGPLSDEQRELRASVDARLLVLSGVGGNVLALAKALGWAFQEADEHGGARCRTLQRALERARAAELGMLVGRGGTGAVAA